ncbi:Spy/CpxP family protein refolding chaperone [Methylobacterium planeticum]|uniref:LTXXQ motif family protein n=1 Tax=Methylobacterium planeticum TaxID=2615211 RepID=A0A6N6MCD4_9HYPH|nr:Spy/CpxP family protein refolding chaperone [Methylobacterium planeticum]KAB1068290.1 LTXXQ motif family protein [Methylobacterium planeticum]
MRRSVISATLLAGIAGLGFVGAAASRDGGEPFRERGPMGRWSNLSPEDRAAFADARIAALHAGLKLNADQEKLWPPVEGAIRDFSKLRREQRAARRERGRMADDAPAALRAMADATVARGEALRKLADASQPLYATLDADQKRRALMLSRPMHGRFGHGHRHPGGDDR